MSGDGTMAQLSPAAKQRVCSVGSTSEIFATSARAGGRSRRSRRGGKEGRGGRGKRGVAS